MVDKIKNKYNIFFMNSLKKELKRRNNIFEEYKEKIELRIDALKSISKFSNQMYNYIIKEVECDFTNLTNAEFKSMVVSSLELKDIKVSVNIMTLNEEKFIEKCIESVKDISSEIIVIDTGSTDNTIEIIRKVYPKVKLYNEKWNNSFSEIRNKMIQYSSGEWIFQIDADEYISKQDKELLELIKIANEIGIDNTVISPVITNYDGHEVELNKRIFKNDKKLRYFGLVHEELRSIYDDSIVNLCTNIGIIHEGYREEVIEQKNKWERNKILLEQMIHLEKNNIRWKYFLAREKISLNESIFESIALLKSCAKLKYKNKFDQDYYLAALIKLCEAYFKIKDFKNLRKTIKIIKKDYPECIDCYYYELLCLYNNSIKKMVIDSDEMLNLMINNEKSFSVINSNFNHSLNLLSIIYFSCMRYNKSYDIYKFMSSRFDVITLEKNITDIKKIFNIN